jgi:hypothetical protein
MDGPARVADGVEAFREACRMNDYVGACELKAEYISPKKRLGTVVSNWVRVNPFWRESVSHVP